MALADWCYGDFDKNNNAGNHEQSGEDSSRNTAIGVAPKSSPSSFDANFNSMQMRTNSVGDSSTGGVSGMTTNLNSLNQKISELENEIKSMENTISKVKDVPTQSSTVEKTAEKKEERESKIDLDRGRDILYAELREWRRLYGEENQVAPYRLFSNKVLDSIVDVLPESEAQLRGIKGVGDKTVDKIKSKVLPLVRHVLDGTPFPEDKSVLKGGSIDTSDSTGAVKAARKNSHSARTAAILSSLEQTSLIRVEDLNEEQLQASQRVLADGKSVFITGSAGTGKSYLTRYLVQELKEVHGERAVAVTASTGIAAVNLGGQTIHSFAGIGLATGTGDIDKVINKVSRNMKAVERWYNAKVIVIDEISMIDSDLFNLLDLVGRKIRNNDRPFGGIQVVLVGDFLQLPPVPNKFKQGNREFCFQSDAWNNLELGSVDENGIVKKNDGGIINLLNVMRQNDQTFVNLLNDIRLGRVSNEQLQELNACHIKTKPRPTDGIVPTKLYSINKDVDKENLDRLLELPGEAVEIEAFDIWSETPSTPTIRKNVKEASERAIPTKILLKVGAQVMLLRNRAVPQSSTGKAVGAPLVNGSRGVVTGFVESTSSVGGLVPRVCFDNGQEVTVGPVEYINKGPGADGQLVRMQIPLKLAWAVTIHKSQGSTLSRAELMLTNTFDYGQAYVALSRVTSVDGLWLTHPLQRSSVKANPLVLNYFKYLEEGSSASVQESQVQYAPPKGQDALSYDDYNQSNNVDYDYDQTRGGGGSGLDESEKPPMF